jgi:hypothetical protein
MGAIRSYILRMGKTYLLQATNQSNNAEPKWNFYGYSLGLPDLEYTKEQHFLKIEIIFPAVSAAKIA